MSAPSATVRMSVIEEQAMAGRVAEFEVQGPWSLNTSRRFWEGFTPAALAGEATGPGVRTVFCAEGDWRRAEAEVTQAGNTARMVLAGDGDLHAAAAQAARFLALDVDGRGWPQVGRRDPVIGGAQARLPGLRPCGFHSPYEAAAWTVLAQRLRIVQAARLRGADRPLWRGRRIYGRRDASRIASTAIGAGKVASARMAAAMDGSSGRGASCRPVLVVTAPAYLARTCEHGYSRSSPAWSLSGRRASSSRR